MGMSVGLVTVVNSKDNNQLALASTSSLLVISLSFGNLEKWSEILL